MNTTQASAPPFPFRRPEPFGVPSDYTFLRAQMPVSKVTSADGKEAWLITRYADIREALRETRLSSDKNHPGYPLQNRFFGTGKPAGEMTFFDMDPPDHTVYRRMFNTDFSPKSVIWLKPRLREIVDSAIDDMLAAGSPIDLVPNFSMVLPTRIIAAILGVPASDWSFLEENTAFLASLRTTPEEASVASRTVLDYFLDLIEAKGKSPGEDLIARSLTEFVAEGSLTKLQLASTCRVLLAAGFETTASMTSLSVVTLLQHPEQLAEFREGDERFTSRAVEELLRFLCVAHVGRRRVAIEDVEIGGVTIGAGDGVIVATDSGDHDDELFERPEALDFHRKPRPIVSFGFGVHQCIGQSLARAELQIALTRLFERIPGLRLGVPVDELRFNQDAMAYGIHELPVRW